MQLRVTTTAQVNPSVVPTPAALLPRFAHNQATIMPLRTLLHIDQHTTADEIRAAVAAGLSPNEADENSTTPIFWAATAEQVRVLVSLGAVARTINSNYETPLHASCAARSAEVTAALLAAGADPRIEDLDGLTPMHLVCDAGHAKALLLAGASVPSDLTPTQHAHFDRARAEIEAERQEKYIRDASAPMTRTRRRA